MGRRRVSPMALALSCAVARLAMHEGHELGLLTAGDGVVVQDHGLRRRLDPVRLAGHRRLLGDRGTRIVLKDRAVRRACSTT